MRTRLTIGHAPMRPDITYSVITACWNSARTITRCIDSVLRQTVLPKEYFFVDGGSSDNTRELIRQSFVDSSDSHSSVAWKMLEQGDVRGISAAWNVAPLWGLGNRPGAVSRDTAKPGAAALIS